MTASLDEIEAAVIVSRIFPAPAGPVGDRGLQGERGADGRSFFSGFGAPRADLGAVDDLYLDLATGDVYKRAETWDLIGSIRGEDGEDGRPGPQGPSGIDGQPGRDGRDGDRGPIGLTGAEGARGPQGWQGPKGEQGPKGDKGDRGQAGKDGAAGGSVWGGGTSIEVESGGSPLGEVAKIDFEGVSVSVVGDRATVSVAPGGSDANFVFTQMSAAATWHIVHGLGKFPAVEVVDSGGSRVFGEVNFIDPNTVDLVFSAPFGGAAYLN